jgi:2',3'-cyclic-nucleotide 2'-phosphodiesterase (5'-nucleotidase family)
MIKLLNSIDEEGIVDAVLGGHKHENNHHFINKIPIVQNILGGYYSNLVYLTFDKTTKKLIRDKIKLEGPLPSCERVFETTRKCFFIPKTEAKDTDKLYPFIFHNQLVEKEASLEPVFYKYWDAIKDYKEVLTFNEVELKKYKDRENQLGNMVTDCARKIASADIAILGVGFLRTEWFPGNLLVESAWNMFPFDDRISRVEVTGEELVKIMQTIQGGEKGLYQVSGLTMEVTLKPNKLVGGSLKLADGSDINVRKTYTLATIPFLLKGGDDFKKVVTWYKPRNEVDFGLFRDRMIEFLKTIGTITETSFIDPQNPRLKVIK